jgi:hypothetical protein
VGRLGEDMDSDHRHQRTIPQARVPYEGKWVKAANVPIGEPILFTSEGWEERTRQYSRKTSVRIFLAFLAMSFLLYLPWLVIEGNRLWPDAFAMAATMAIGFPIMISIVMAFSFRKFARMGIWSGLYEKGLLVTYLNPSQTRFVPYFLMERAEVHPYNFINSLPMLRVNIKGFKQPVTFDVKGILGDDGVALLHQMIAVPPGSMRDGPPELHVYGDGGAVVTSIPGTSGEIDGKGPD